MSNLLEIKGLRTEFFTDGTAIPAVDDVSLTIGKRETLGIVGESGCGKSVTSLSVMRLLPRVGARIASGEILFKDRDLLKLSLAEIERIRGNEIAMIFQEPMTSLNPVYPIGQQLTEVVMLHRGYNKSEARQHAIQMLKQVHIPRAEKIIDEYPHQLSGGMRQRVMIAMAVSCDPELLIADEPTTALDVTIQAQILDLMQELREVQGMSIMLITHDLGVVSEMCDRVVVMYAGQVVEQADINSLFDNPCHPYTQGLLKSMPGANIGVSRLESISGSVPLPGTVLQGCHFASRCSLVTERCLKVSPPLFKLKGARRCRCWLHEHSALREVANS